MEIYFISRFKILQNANYVFQISYGLDSVLNTTLIFRFLLQCLEDLDSSLRKLNSRLFVIRGQPADVLPTLFKAEMESGF